MKTILETPRLILREMTQEDYPALAAILRDEQTMYAYEGAFSESETQAWLDKNLARYRDDGIGLWAVIIKDSGSMIGQAGLTWQDVNGRRVPEVGYLFNRAYWGKGYATEAAIACKEYGFSQLGFDEIYTIVRDTNIASMNVAIRNGMNIRERFTKHYKGIDMPHYAFSAKNEFQTKLEEMGDFFNTRAERYDNVHIEHIDGGAEYHFDTPCTVDNNKKMLADAGFADVREVWSVKNTTVLIARKLSGSFRVEPAARDEIYEVAAFLDACWKTEYSDIIAPDFLTAMSVTERYEKLLIRFDEDISGFLVMRDAEKMLGAAVFGRSFTEGYPDDGEISAIYLHHDFIGKGYGHALFTKIEQELTDMGYTHFVLDVLSENKRAVKFYLDHGYEKVAENYIRLGEKDYPLTVFRKANVTIMGEEKEMRP